MLPALSPSAFAQNGAVALSLTGGSLPPGGVIALRLSLEETAAPPSTLVVKLGFDTSRLSVSDAIPGAAASGKTLTWRQTDGGLAVLIFGGEEAISPGSLATLYLEAANGADVGDANAAPGASSASDASPSALAVTFETAPIIVAALANRHSADTDGNGRIGLSELLRVIQLFNAGGYGCDASTEDGFVPGGSDRQCAPHALDYQEEDWRLDLSELLRCIQFYNSFKGTYHPDAAGEDGFAPGLD